MSQDPRAQAALLQWRKLSQTEVDCVDRALQARRSSLWAVIQQGVTPSTGVAAQLLSACRSSAGTNSSRAAQDAARTLTASAQGAPDTAAARAERAAAEKAAAEKAAAERAERAAAARAAAEKAAADRAAAQKAAAEKAGAEKLAAEKASAEKAAAETATAEKAAAEKAAAEKAPADAAEEKAARTSALEHAANQTATDSATLNTAAPEAPKPERYTVASANTPEQRREARFMSEAAMAYAAAESRMSFIYGLITGPIIFGCGGAMFMLIGRRRRNRLTHDAELAEATGAPGRYGLARAIAARKS